MDVLTIIVLWILGLLIYSPSKLLAEHIRAKQKGVQKSELTFDDTWRLSLLICIPIGLCVYIILQLTGLWDF